MASSIPLAVPQLISIAQTALPAGTLVWFGKALGVFNTPITLQILRVTGEQIPAELGPNYRREETFSIECEIDSWAGDVDQPSRMSEVFNTAFYPLAVAIANNYTLNSTVRFAECTAFHYEPDNDASGRSLGRLSFEIVCSQRITSLS